MVLSHQAIGLVAVMCESILVGAYLVLTGLVVWILVSRWQPMPRIHRILFGASIFMFCVSVTHLGLVIQEKTVTGKPPLANAQSQIILSTIQFVIGDLILIWRVWVMWERSYWVAAGPFAIMLAAAACTIELAFSSKVRRFFIVAPVALIVANTSICTILIAGRIWYMYFRLRKFACKAGIPLLLEDGYRRVLMLIIESGALYTACQFISLILDHIDSIGLPVILDLEIPLIGILPTLIMVLVHFDQVLGTKTVDEYVASRSLHFTSTTKIQTATVGMRGTSGGDDEREVV
ncbi:hypothetical protein D9615_006579 [Tricholomella constricta]|uniref:Uncharacterized protein n=1 Tax=Tricholomella constricta TaxID=117010 RepID=A0A8H5H9Z0_9AGAR|nr:hypothetical protein D9615_006579 [Tricholomella constricta]